MKRLSLLGIGALVLYGAFTLGANLGNTAGIASSDRAELNGMRVGDLKKLVFHEKIRDRVDETFRDEFGNGVEIADYEGKVVVLNFWATWCPPCRKEMPGIDRLAGAMGGDDLEVLALSTDRFDVKRVVDFFDEIDVQHLRVLQDRKGAVARKAGVLGLPVTVILDRQGREIARMQGEAEWDSPAAQALLARVIELTAPGT
ncbi:MAG: TlpA disulfide reductase family protein [Pseudomonadota bacterium]